MPASCHLKVRPLHDLQRGAAHQLQLGIHPPCARCSEYSPCCEALKFEVPGKPVFASLKTIAGKKKKKITGSFLDASFGMFSLFLDPDPANTYAWA